MAESEGQQNDQQNDGGQQGGGEQGNQAVPYARFKEVNDRARQMERDLAALKAQQEAAAEAAAKEQGKYKELYEKAQADLAERQRADWARAACQKAGIDPAHADRLRGDTEEALLADAREYAKILPKPEAPKIDADTKTSTATTFTLAQIQDPAFYQAHRTEIMQAQREGRIRR